MQKRRKFKKLIYLLVAILFFSIFGFDLRMALVYSNGSNIDKSYILATLYMILYGDLLLVLYYIIDNYI